MFHNCKPYKRDAPYSYALGVLPTLELLRARPSVVQQVLLSTSSEQSRGVALIRELCAAHGISAAVDNKALRRLAQADNCYAAGVFAKYCGQLSARLSHVVLVNPDDMGNVGTIMRTMLGYGVRDLAVIQPAADLFHPKAVRASMGALFHLRCESYVSIAAYRKLHTHEAYAFMTNGESELAVTAFSNPCALIFGNEGRGLPEYYAQLAHGVRIEHGDAIDSLNLAVAAGIALHRIYASQLLSGATNAGLPA